MSRIDDGETDTHSAATGLLVAPAIHKNNTVAAARLMAK
jgi:hypothetical protein